MAKFELGRVVQTRGVYEYIAKGYPIRVLMAMECLERHINGDWGDVPPEDAALNDAAIAATGDERQRVLSSYLLDEERIWIITEWDRSVTTLLFPSEY